MTPRVSTSFETTQEILDYHHTERYAEWEGYWGWDAPTITKITDPMDTTPELLESHPMDKFLRGDRMPHIWCSGCGAGNVMTSYVKAIEELKYDLNSHVVVAGIGCTGRIPGYLNLDTFHTTHGRAIPFATGMKLANPNLHVSVISGDGDLFAIGGNHFLHAARRNVDMLVICVNNYIYGMTGGQLAPTTPMDDVTTTSPFGNFEPPFNLPYLAMACGAVYVARWTTIHLRRLTDSIIRALSKKGFCFIEVISPCPTNFGKLNKKGEAIDIARQFQKNSVIKHNSNPFEAGVEEGKDLTLGVFIDRDDKLSYLDHMSQMNEKVMVKDEA